MGDDVDNSVLAERIDRITSDISEIKIAVNRLAGDMERVIRLEERHATHSEALTRAFTRVETIEIRLAKLEAEVPITRMVRGWVISGVVGVVGLLGTQMAAVLWYFTKQMP